MPVSRDQLVLAMRDNQFRLSLGKWYSLEEISRHGRTLFPELVVSDLTSPLGALVGQGIVLQRLNADRQREYSYPA